MIPADDLARHLKISAADDPDAPHVGVAGGTYTILVAGKDTAGRYCLIDMHVPAGAGPPPHRHNFEESFTVLAGEIVATFRGQQQTVRAGQVINIPATLRIVFKNSAQPARLLCICSPAGMDDYFLEIGVPVATRTTPPPIPDAAAQAAFRAKVQELSPKYGIVLE